MTARIFISYRSSDGADKATALSRDLDELFGNEQVFLDKEDLPAGSRWRDEIAHAIHSGPILLVLVTPNYLGARDAEGRRCIDRADDPAREELQVGLAAGAHIIPLMCDGVWATPPAAELPSPFDQLAERTWRRLRAFDWREDLARLAADLRKLGAVPRDAAAAMVGAGLASSPSPLASAPLPLAGAAAAAAPAARSGRRLAIGAGAVALLALGGWGAWRWQESRAANLSGRWRARVGRHGASSARDGELMLVTLEHDGQRLRLTSTAVNVEHDPDWQHFRDAWKQRTGSELRRVLYRGEGKVFGADDAHEAIPAGREIRRDGDERVRAELPAWGRRVSVAIRIDVPGGAGAPVDKGELRGIVEGDDQRIRGRLLLDSEQGERVVDLRRDG